MLPYRVGHGFDLHRLAEGYKLIIGGVDIPHTKGCEAHSDGAPWLRAAWAGAEHGMPGRHNSCGAVHPPPPHTQPPPYEVHHLVGRHLADQLAAALQIDSPKRWP